MTKTSKAEEKSQESFMSKLKTVCKNCTKGTILVYFRNVKRLYRLIPFSEEEKEIPSTGTWLKSKTLVEKYKKLPLKVRRHLSIAAVKALKAYKEPSEKWEILMYKDASAYERERGKNKRTDKEKSAWPKGGLNAVKKASKEQWKRVKLLLNAEPNLKTLYKYQLFLALKLFSELPFRNLFPTFSLEKSDGNYIRKPKKGNFVFVVQQHKAAKKIGTREVTLSRASTMAVRKFLKYRANVSEIKHNFLLSNKKGEKMSKSGFSKAMHRITKDIIGKSFGSRLIRILSATELKPELDKVADLKHKMLHSEGSKQTKQYTRKT